MTQHTSYSPGPARGAEVKKDGATDWTLVLVRDPHWLVAGLHLSLPEPPEAG